MLKLFVFSALVALTSANHINKFVGEWRTIKAFAKDPVIQDCHPFHVEDLKEYCTCGSDSKVSKLKLTVANKDVVFPALYVDSFSGVTDSLKTECTCDDKKTGHYVIYHINDNYTFMLFTHPFLNFAVLLSKSVPAEADVNEFINSIEYFKDKTSYFVCSSDLMNSNEKVTTGKKWWQHEKSQF
ncbi:hypothetical protein NE865_03039 [Phthorimaea operculella]|nr:hypothetical protein NE865_03039 [Phthorimaea operculella]